MIVLLSLLAIAVSVYLLAVITEEYFVVSLDKVAKQLEMPSDVAGASLMAVGSSAPELFIALIAVFIGGSHSEVGIGTIVGSAVFNILVITGAAAAIAGTLTIKAGAVERDIIFYLGSVAILLFVFWNGEIVIWEALLMLGAYVGYLGLLWYWSRTNPEEAATSTVADKVEHEPGSSPLARIHSGVARFIGLAMRDPEKNYVWAMLVSIALIAALSYVLVEAAVALSAALGLPPVIVSLTLLAAGTSAPDLIASIDVARDGRGTMAVANAVGSNIFDVLIGLGVPWLLTLLIVDPLLVVGTEGLLESIFLLSVTVIILYIFLYTGRRLSRVEGFILLGVYVVYVIYVIVTNSSGGAEAEHALSAISRWLY
ncbi:MAG: calcium/sodium antiporter [Chloroflexota bacterium]